MIPWSNTPFVKIVIPYAVGILLASAMGYSFRMPTWMIIAAMAPVAILAFWPRRFIHYRNRYLYGLLISAILMLAGLNRAYLSNSPNAKSYFTRHYANDCVILLKVRSGPEARKSKMRFSARICGIIEPEGIRNASGEVMVFSGLSSPAAFYKTGDLIAVRADTGHPFSGGNPMGFDYSRYLGLQNIHHCLFIDEALFIRPGGSGPLNIQGIAADIRNWMIKEYARHGFGGRELAVVSALVLGYSKDLDNDVRNDFVSSGAMHILCVSGMHVAIIYFVVVFMLKPLVRLRYGRIIRNLTVLGCVWLYALIAGLTPSVLRSAVMFSFIIAGSFHGSRISVYNNLAASAFFLLLLEPKMIFHAGFQFSYLAVLSIVSLHPHIYHLVTLRNKVADQIWALLSVSVAAQAGTAPLSIWYFHIFPNYFIAGNLLAVPLSTLILYGSVGYLALSPVAAAGGLMMKALHLLVQGMNASVAYIEQLPHSVSRGIWIPGEAVILIYILLMMAGFALEARLYRPSMAAVLLFLLLAADYSMHNAASYLREEFVVFNAGRTALAAFYDARTEHLYNVGDARDKYRMDYLENRRMHHRVRRFCSYGSLSDDNSAILNDRVFAGRGFIIFHAEERRYMIAVGETYDWPNDRIRVDVLVLGRRSGSFEKILALADPAIVVLDATIGRRKASSIAEYCIKAGIPCHDVGIQGAFVATVYRFDSVFRFLGRKCFRSA